MNTVAAAADQSVNQSTRCTRGRAEHLEHAGDVEVAVGHEPPADHAGQGQHEEHRERRQRERRERGDPGPGACPARHGVPVGFGITGW